MRSLLTSFIVIALCSGAAFAQNGLGANALPPGQAASPPAGGIATINGLTSLPVLLKRVEPDFGNVTVPLPSRSEVWVEVLVRPNGTVTNAAIARSVSPEIDAAALAAVEQWLYRPSMRNGVPVATHMTLPVLVIPRPKISREWVTAAYRLASWIW